MEKEKLKVNNELKAIGTLYYSNGNKYEGEWKNDKMEGKGILFFNSLRNS